MFFKLSSSHSAKILGENYDYHQKAYIFCCFHEVCVNKTTVYKDGFEALILYKGTQIYGERVDEKWYKVFLVTGLEGLVSASDVVAVG